MYAINEINICAEYQGMPPSPRRFSGMPLTSGILPGTWKIYFGLGGITQYSAKILICIVFKKNTYPLNGYQGTNQIDPNVRLIFFYKMWLGLVTRNTIEVLECISNFTPNFTGHVITYMCWG